MNINSTTLDRLRTSFTSLYNGSYLSTPSHYQDLAMVVNSTGKDETYGWLGNTTAFREWLGDRVVQNLSESGFVIKNKAFENTVSVKRADIEDDNVGVYSPLFQMLGMDAKLHPDTLLFPLITAGFATACYDGQYFFDTDHPVVDAAGVTQSVSNTGGGSGAAWFLLDTSKPIKPFIYQKRKDYSFVSLTDESNDNVFKRAEYVYGVDGRGNVGYGLWQLAYGSKQTLDAAAYETGRAAMIGMKGDGGKPLNVMPNILLVGPSNEAAAKKIVAAAQLAGGATNTNFNTAKVVVVPWLV